MSQAMDSPVTGVAPSGDGTQRFRVEDRYHTLVDAVTDYAVFMLDPDGIVSTWNTGAERIKGYSALEIVGRHFSAFYPPEAINAGLPRRMLATAAAEGKCVDEGWRVRKDGSLFWANVIITALRAPGGELIGFGKVTRDLTERREAEQALSESNRRQTEMASYLRNILNGSTLVSIIATDLDGVITLFNRGAERMLGYDAVEMVGLQTPVLLHVPEEIASRGRELSAVLGRAVEGFDVFTSSIGLKGFDQLEWTYIRKDRRLITVILSLSAIRDEAGEAIGYLGVAEDVTERREVARRLTAAYTQLNAALECMSDCVMTLGRDWTILYGNQRMIDLLPDFKIGRSYWECFPMVLGSPTETLLRDAMNHRVPASYEKLFEIYDIWFKIRLFPSEVGLSIFFTNITEEKKLQERIALEQVLREKRIEGLSHMAGGLAHEISNPLAIIHARASDLGASIEAGEAVSTEEIARSCKSIVDTSDRAMRILRGLRGFAREAGGDPMEWASMQHIIEQCLELQEARFERHGISLTAEVAAEIPPVLCRETQVGQILTNLLNNAFDAIDHSGAAERWVTLTARAKETTVEIDVEDSGPGIDGKFRPYLMEPFFTTKTKGLGMGVGLSLSRAIAQEHGGSLRLSDQDGHTCFQLVLPYDSTLPG